MNYRIITPSLQELDDIISSQPGVDQESHLVKLPGFVYTSRSAATSRLARNLTDYQKETTLKPFEVQEETHPHVADYDITVAAMKGDELVGLQMMMWTESFYKHRKMWSYANRFIDVKDGHKNQKIATTMLKTLEQQPQLQGKVIRFGQFQNEGKKYLRNKNTIKKVFSNNNYYVLPKDSRHLVGEFPKEYGCYLVGRYN